MQKKFSNKSPKAAFSIVELSIVALIISALIGTIISANRMLFNSRLATAQTLTKSSPVNDIDNLVLWYETTMPKSFNNLEADNNKAVSTWYDLGPNRSNATAGNAPTYIADGINGLPVLRFNGSTNYFNYNGTFVVNTNYTVFVVEQRRSLKAAGMDLFVAGLGGAGNQMLHLGYRNDTFLTFAQFGNDIDYAVASYVSPIPRVHSFVFNSSFGKTAHLNGVQQFSDTGSAAKEGLTANPNSTIGNIQNWGPGFYNGDLAEIIMFSKALSTSERKDVEQYLGKKWGITVS